MKILIIPDSFKSTLSSIEVSEILTGVFTDDGFETLAVPIGDGGEGTIDAIQYTIGGKKKYINVLDPLGRNIRTYYIIKEDVAFIEISKSSGLMLLKESEYNPLITSTFGFGQILNDAINNNIRKIYLGLGGTATNDAGIGMLSELGVKFFESSGNEIQGLLCGSFLKKITQIDISEMKSDIKNIDFKVITDVQNTLTGENGATKIYAPQKGADSKMVNILEEGMLNFVSILKRDFDFIPEFPGAGAAGGVGGVLKLFMNAEINPGVEYVINLLNLEKRIAESDIIIVGEGSIDYQSAYGKAPVGIARIAKKYDKRVIVIAGKTGERIDELYKEGIDLIFSYYGNVKINLEFVKKNSSQMLKQTAGFAKEIITSYPYLKNKNFVYNETKNIYNPQNS